MFNAPEPTMPQTVPSEAAFGSSITAPDSAIVAVARSRMTSGSWEISTLVWPLGP
jgi:hypothetical protein